MLASTPEPLVSTHDMVMFDLDGVVYISGHLIDHAAEAIARVRAAGARVTFVTNNASRTAAVVARRIQEMGARAEAEEVITSSQAATRLLLESHGEGARILVLGTRGLASTLQDAGLVPVVAGSADEEETVAVVSGYGPEVVWKDLMRVAVRIARGLPWVATNADYSIPTEYGIAPGHGVQVQMLSRFTGVEPQLAGKPERPLFDEAVRRVGSERPLMVGDRLDTDIQGARAAGIASLLVMTGVTELASLTAAPVAQRPTYLSPDARGLHEPHPQVDVEGEYVTCGGWSARVDRGALRVTGDGTVADWWRTVAVAGWRHLDESGEAADVAGLQPPTEAAG